MSEESLQQGKVVQRLIHVRWVVVALLFVLEAYLLRSFSVNSAEWRPTFLLLGAYVLANVLFQAMLGSRVERAAPGLIASLAVLGLLLDMVVLSLFSYNTADSFRPYSFALYVLTIFEAGVLFSEGVMFLVFFASLAFFGFDASRALQGEVFIEQAWQLIPQGLLLVLVMTYALALRKNIAQHSAELSYSKQLTEAVVESLSDGILIIDQDARILFINKAGEAILGVQGRELLGVKVRKSISYPIKNITNVLKVLASVQDGASGDVQLEHPEEKLLKVMYVSLQDTSGMGYGQMFVIRDVSRDALLNKLKSDFISIAAHQLRTPLSSVKWAFSMLAEGGLGVLSEDQKPVVAQGLETTDRLVRLVNSLLNVSRIDEGRFGYEFGQVDAGVLIAKVLETLRPKMESRGIRIGVHVPEKLPATAADPEKIELVLENIVDNAISYTQEGGEVLVEAVPEDKFLRFLVRDNGVGIPKSQQQLLYSKFFRGDNVIRMQTDGSGLGLYIAKNIIEKHGGTINVTSAEGEGTTVSFTIPFA